MLANALCRCPFSYFCSHNCNFGSKVMWCYFYEAPSPQNGMCKLLNFTWIELMQHWRTFVKITFHRSQHWIWNEARFRNIWVTRKADHSAFFYTQASLIFALSLYDLSFQIVSEMREAIAQATTLVRNIKQLKATAILSPHLPSPFPLLYFPPCAQPHSSTLPSTTNPSELQFSYKCRHFNMQSPSFQRLPSGCKRLY